MELRSFSGRYRREAQRSLPALASSPLSRLHATSQRPLERGVRSVLGGSSVRPGGVVDVGGRVLPRAGGVGRAPSGPRNRRTRPDRLVLRRTLRTRLDGCHPEFRRHLRGAQLRGREASRARCRRALARQSFVLVGLLHGWSGGCRIPCVLPSRRPPFGGQCAFGAWDFDSPLSGLWVVALSLCREKWKRLRDSSRPGASRQVSARTSGGRSPSPVLRGFACGEVRQADRMRAAFGRSPIAFRRFRMSYVRDPLPRVGRSFGGGAPPLQRDGYGGRSAPYRARSRAPWASSAKLRIE